MGKERFHGASERENSQEKTTSAENLPTRRKRSNPSVVRANLVRERRIRRRKIKP